MGKYSNPGYLAGHPRLLIPRQAAQFGVDVNLVRISVGLEEASDLVARVKRALATMEATAIEPT